MITGNRKQNEKDFVIKSSENYTTNQNVNNNKTKNQQLSIKSTAAKQSLNNYFGKHHTKFETSNDLFHGLKLLILNPLHYLTETYIILMCRADRIQNMFSLPPSPYIHTILYLLSFGP